MPDLPTGTATFLFTDVEGSTRLWEQHPEAMRDALARHDTLLRQAIEAHRGSVFKTVGDQFCAAFGAAPDALSVALAAQRVLQAEGWSDVGALRVRMAMHTGAAEVRDGDYFGLPLNRVARLLAAAHGGQILLSLATEQLVRDALPQGTTLRDLGSHRLKDLQQPERIFQLLHPDLPADFPPLRSLEAFAHNLPIQLTSFIGREQEIAEVKDLLVATRLLTLTGSGGCGKTRLALQVAVDLVEVYPDGVWLVELASLADPALILQAVASALGVREEPNRPVLATLSDYLRPRELLLVLDNCEHLVTACAELVEALLRSCPNLRILATSRERLGLAGEFPWRVPSLSLPDPHRLPALERLTQYEAVRLFIERAHVNQPGFTLRSQSAPSVVQVCHRLDGIPLAIELAAARVRVLSVEQIAQRLEDRFRLLTGGSRTAVPRQQTLQATIDWSYELLSEPERVLLCRLSVFAGGFTMEVAEAVCAGEGIDVFEVLDLLAQLVDKSLVLVEAGEEVRRYRLLETIREYGREKLRGLEEEAVLRHRHRDWYLGLAEAAEGKLQGPQQGEWLERLERDHDNLRAALGWAEESDREAALRLAGAVCWFWEIRGYYGEGRRWLEGLLEGSGGGTTPARAKALSGAGTIAWHQGDYERAGALHEAALGLYREMEDKRGIAFSLNNLGVLAGERGDYRRAGALYEESLALSREAGDKRLMYYSLFNLGVQAVAHGEYEQATARYEECLVLAREMGNQWLTAVVLVNLGQRARDAGDYGRAAAFLTESLALARQLGEKWVIANALLAMGIAAYYQGEYVRARALLTESLAMRRELGDKRGTVECLEGLAGVVCAVGQPELGTRLYGAAEALREGIGVPKPPNERAEYDRTVALARAVLGEEAFAATWAAGRAMMLEQVIACASEEGIHI